jgi:prepilin-type N-terminal cleavage/methylation domain-containing protein
LPLPTIHYPLSTTHSRRSRAGLTLIELLAASALAALLLAAVSGILGLLSRQHHELISQQPGEPWQRRLVEQLQWDFANARHYEAAPKQLTLVGYGGRNFDTHAPVFCRAEIRYEVLDIGGRSCLVRREIHPDDRALDNFRAELVCADVAAIDVRTLDTAAGGNRPPAPGSIPRKLRVTLRRTGTDAGDKAIELMLHMF